MSESEGGRTGVEDQIRGRWDAVLEQLPVGVVIAEAPGGRLIFGNRRAEEIWGYPLLSSAGADEFHRRQGFHADGRPYLAEEWPLARAIATGEVVETEEIQIVRGDGRRAVVQVSAKPMRDERGEVIAGMATFHDVTEQRRLEVGRRFLADAGATLASSLEYQTTLTTLARLAVPLLADWCSVDILNEDGKVERLAVEHTDPARRELALQLTRRFPPSLDAQGGAAAVMRSGRSQLIPSICERVLRGVARDEEHLELLRQLELRSGMLVPLTVRGRTIGAIAFYMAESGRAYGPEDLGLAEELAMRAALAIDNARLYGESQAASRAKSDFLAVMSHELRTPLTAIIGYAELMELGIPEPVTVHQHEQVQRIGISARHLLTLIEEILTVVSLEGGRARIYPERIRVGDLLDRAVGIVEPLAKEKGLPLRISAAPADEWVVVDSGKVIQILLNLLTNAVKFTQEGEVSVEAELREDALRFVVQDTGIGITDDHRRKMFEPFWQAEQAITRQVGGAGLGLTVTYRLAALLGGEIQVESEPGKGSTFTVTLPLQLELPVREAPQRRVARES